MARVERHGSGWRAVYAGPDGERCRERLPARTKAEAKELTAKLERRAWLQRRGLEVTPDDLTGTLAELCLWWLDKRCPAASRATEALRLQKHIIGRPIGTMPLGSIRTAAIDDLLHDLEREGAQRRASTRSDPCSTPCSLAPRKPAAGSARIQSRTPSAARSPGAST